MDLVTVTNANDADLAGIIKGVLEQAGIPAMIASSGSSEVFPMPSILPYRILVAPADLERARDILDQYDAQPDEAEEE